MTATLIEDPDLCLWCGRQPARLFGFCTGCAADALTIPNPITDPPRPKPLRRNTEK